MKIEEYLVGLKIDHLLEIHDYIQVYFTNGDILNLNNRYDCCPRDLANFQNEEVTRFFDNDEYMILETKSGYSIKMSMLLEDAIDPEAAVLYRKGTDNQIIVWEQVN